MGISIEPFGKTKDGRQVDMHILRNAKGMVLKVLSLGGIIHSLELPDRDGKVANVSCLSLIHI